MRELNLTLAFTLFFHDRLNDILQAKHITIFSEISLYIMISSFEIYSVEIYSLSSIITNIEREYYH